MTSKKLGRGLDSGEEMVSSQTGRPHSIFFFSNLIIILIEAERKGKKCADIFSLSLSSVWRLWGGYRRYCW